MQAPRFRRSRIDAVTALTGFVILLFIVPSALSISALGSMGKPTTLVGLAALIWWAWHHLNRRQIRERGTQPVRWAMLLFLLTILASYVHAMWLPIPADEMSPADSAVLRILGFMGVSLVAIDGIRTTARMTVLIRILVIMVALTALLSIVQFATGQLWLDRISVPGLTASSPMGLDERQEFTRPSGTATHPIEFASVLSMTLPIALMYAKSRSKFRVFQLLPPALIVVAVALSLSRTAILSVAVGLLLIVPALPRIWRMWGIAAGAALTVFLFFAVPGFIGTLRGLFVGAADDPSVQSRIGAYDLTSDFVSRSPLFGRGLGTFLPRYTILDNMYLQLLVEIGILGLAATLGLFITAMVSAWGSRKGLRSQAHRDLATGLAAGVAAGAFSFALFDGLSFPQTAFTLFLLIGMCGAYWRLSMRGQRPKPG